MNKQHYAVVVGIDHYPAINSLKFARRDARGFYDWLVDRDGGAVPEKNARLITVRPPRNGRKLTREEAHPIKREIENELDRFRQQCKAHVARHPEDWEETRLYFFASGHGIAPEANESALLMADAGPGYYSLNFSCAQYLSHFQKEQVFKELVFFADCCRERADDAAITGPGWDRSSRQNGQVLTLRGYATIFGELAFEPQVQQRDPDQMRGYFTQALLEGLKGHPDSVNPATRTIDSDSLARFVTARVETLTAGLPRKQTPAISLEPATPRIIFRKNVSVEGLEKNVHKRHKVHLVFPAGFQGTVRLVNGTSTTIATYDVGAPGWDLKLEIGIYQVQLADGTSPFKVNGYFSVSGEDTHVEF